MNEINQTITASLLVLNFTSVFVLTVHIVWMLSQDVFVQFLCFMEFTHRLVQTGQIVGRGHRNGVVVMLIVFSFSFGTLQWCKKVFLWQTRHSPCWKHRLCTWSWWLLTCSILWSTLASPRLPSLKWSAPRLLRISGGTSACTFSCRMRVAVPYADRAPWMSVCSRIWASSIQASTSSGYCSVTFFKWPYGWKRVVCLHKSPFNMTTDPNTSLRHTVRLLR